MENTEIEIFKSEDGTNEIEVRIDKDTVWLNQYQISELFLTDRTSIGRHIGNIYKTNERKLKEQNEQLKELQESVKVLEFKELTNDESVGLLKIISDYAYALDILDQYDYQSLEIRDTSGKETYRLTYKEAINQIRIAKKAHGNSDLFGQEKDKSFQSSVATNKHRSNLKVWSIEMPKAPYSNC